VSHGCTLFAYRGNTTRSVDHIRFCTFTITYYCEVVICRLAEGTVVMSVQGVEWLMARGSEKSQVRQCLDFCTAYFQSSLACESAGQKPKHCLTWDFSQPLLMAGWLITKKSSSDIHINGEGWPWAILLQYYTFLSFTSEWLISYCSEKRVRAHGEKWLAKGNLCSLCLCTSVNRAEKRMIRMEEEEEDVLRDRPKPVSAEIFCRISNRIFCRNRIIARLQ